MEKQIEKVVQFHEVFKQEMSDKPTLISEREYLIRFNLGLEELKEYADACQANDLVEILDSLADQLYIILGTAVKHGLQHKLAEAFDLVHENNMSKLGPDGNPILREDGKILKPEGFVPVDLSKLIENNG